MIRRIVCSAVIALTACTDAVGPVEVSTTNQQALRIENGTSGAIYYFAIEANALALANWAPCSNPRTCPNVQPGQSREIPFSDIALYTPAAETALLHWWHLRPTGSGTFAPDSIRAVRIALRPGASR